MATPKPTPCILSTGNIMSAASEVLRSPSIRESSTELIASLRSHIRASPPSPPPSPSPATSSASSPSPLYIPLLPTPEPLSEDRAEYDVTVKLFHLPAAAAASHATHTRDAVHRVLAALGIATIDLLILSLPGITFDAEDTAAGVTADEVASYRALEALHIDDDGDDDGDDDDDDNGGGGGVGVIARLGISEFGTARLTQLLPLVRVRPSVNQINVRDCCVVPRPLILFAKAEAIELLTHNDCEDVLPRDVLRAVLVDEFAVVEKGRDVVPQWVVKYTVVVRSRGVVENKGYIAMAEIQ